MGGGGDFEVDANVYSMARVGGRATFELASDFLASVDVQVLQTLACRNVCELRFRVRS